MIKVKDLYPLILEAFKEDKSFTMPIHGTSMQPLLHTGDSVILVKPDCINKDDIVFFIREDGDFVLHRVYKINNDGSYEIIGDHQVVIEHNIKREQIFARVEAIKINNRVKPLKGFFYRLYLLTLKSFFIRRVYIKCLR